MDMRTYLHSISIVDRELLADKCGTSVDYFWQIAGGHRKPSALLAKKIEKYTNGLVTRKTLRPDIFGEIEQDPAA